MGDALPAGEPRRGPDGLSSEAAFRTLYRAELAHIVRTVRRLGVRPADVEDVAHDVVLTAFVRRDSFDPTRPVGPWLFGIAYRVVANHFRRRGRSAEVPLEPQRLPADASSDPGPAREARDLLLAALAAIDLEHRAVVVMHDLDGAGAPEVAQALAIPVNTAYSRLRNGRAKLAAAVRRLEGESR